MALFKIFKGSSAELGNTAATINAHEGYLYFTEDEGKFYIDITNGAPAILGVDRIPLNAYKADRSDNFYADSITTGDLIVNGNSSFVNNVSFSTIPISITPAANSNDRSVATTEFVTSAISNHIYTLPVATNNSLGGIEIGYSENGKNYAVQLDENKAYVNVPWTDTIPNLSSANDIDNYNLLLTADNGSYLNNTYTKSNLLYNASSSTLITSGFQASSAAISELTASSLQVSGYTTFSHIPLSVTPNDNSNGIEVATTAFVKNIVSTFSNSIGKNLTIGSYVYNGTADISIPIYDGLWTAASA